MIDWGRLTQQQRFDIERLYLELYPRQEQPMLAAIKPKEAFEAWCTQNKIPHALSIIDLLERLGWRQTRPRRKRAAQ